jgi:hypothetical protein
MRAARGEAGGPRALGAVLWELRGAEELLRRDAAALAPDAACLRRMARAGVLRYLPAAASTGAGVVGATGVLVSDATLAATRHYARLAALRRLGTVASPLMPSSKAGGSGGGASGGDSAAAAAAAHPAVSVLTRAADAGAIHAEDVALRLGLDTPAGACVGHNWT